MPLVFTTSGGMGPECTRLNQRIAELIANKRKERYSHVIKHVRTRLRFSLSKSVLIAIRGYRGASRDHLQDIGDIDFNLIPKEVPYESYGG